MRIALEDVTVRLGRRDVLSGLTWLLPEHGRTLLLGRNGAGKTTTLRLASGALSARAGAPTIDGRRAKPRELRRTVALMPQTITAVPGLSVLEQVTFAAWLAGHPERLARTKALDALEKVDLLPMQDRAPAKLSGGELRRVGLAEALARPGDLLLLDEPTTGLDPTQRARFREILLAVDRPTVVSTHQLDDVDELYDFVALLESGQIVFTGAMSDFLGQGQGPDNARRAESAFVRLAVLTRQVG